MDDKSSTNRKSSGEKHKKSSKKRRKSKPKYRDGEHRKRTSGKLQTGFNFKSSSPDETNSDSALEFAKRHSKKHNNLSKVEPGILKAKISLAGITSSGSLSMPSLTSTLRSDGAVSQSITSEASLRNRPQESSFEPLDIQKVTEQIRESLRWDNVCPDPEQEAERIRIYKINRRKRYLAELMRRRQDKESLLRFAKEIAAIEEEGV